MRRLAPEALEPCLDDDPAGGVAKRRGGGDRIKRESKRDCHRRFENCAKS